MKAIESNLKYPRWHKTSERLTVETALENAKNEWEVKSFTIRTSGCDLDENIYDNCKDALKGRIVTFVDYNPLLKSLYISTETWRRNEDEI